MTLQTITLDQFFGGRALAVVFVVDNDRQNLLSIHVDSLSNVAAILQGLTADKLASAGVIIGKPETGGQQDDEEQEEDA